MIVYDGETGGLGRYLGKALSAHSLSYTAFHSRLEESAGFGHELQQIPALLPGSTITFLQLAAKVSVPECEKSPEAAMKTNVTHRLARARAFTSWARSNKLLPRLVYVSTAHIYAPVASPRRIQEADPIAPRSVYAKTKYDAEVALVELGKTEKVEVLVARVFGIVAPAQPQGYVLPGLLRRVREKDTSPIPGLRNVRDYLDARDICAHLAELASLTSWPTPLLINICSGEPISIEELWNMLVRTVPGAASLPAPQEAPGRPDDIPWIVGDPTRLVDLLGHPPRLTPLKLTLRDALKNPTSKS